MIERENEKELIQKCKEGDIDSFELLIESYQQRVYNIALRMLGNKEDASDIAQEVFIKIYKSIAGFKEEASLSTWIYRIATNVCLDELRKRKKTKVISIDSTIQLEDSEVSMQMPDERPQPDELLTQKELKQEVQKAINDLKEEHKTVIILRDINGYSYEEIAKILDCTLGTVKSRINRARNTLKNILIKREELLSENSV